MDNVTHTHGATKPTYNLIYVILFVVTIMEILVAGITGVIGATALLILTCIKAGLVAGYYMHLKYDPPIFTWILLVPMLMGAGVILSLQALAGY